MSTMAFVLASIPFASTNVRNTLLFSPMVATSLPICKSCSVLTESRVPDAPNTDAPSLNLNNSAIVACEELVVV